MIDEVGREARFPLLLLRQIPCQLVNDRTDHLQMPKLLRADVRQEALQLRIGHGIALAQIPEGSAKLPVWTAILRNDDRREARVGIGDLDRILQPLFIYKHAQPSLRYSHGHGSFSHVYVPLCADSSCVSAAPLCWYCCMASS